MRSISIEDLHERTTELLETVRDQERSYVVHTGGTPIAFISPLRVQLPETPSKVPPSAEGWESYLRLSDELRRRWPADAKAESILDEIRRSS